MSRMRLLAAVTASLLFVSACSEGAETPEQAPSEARSTSPSTSPSAAPPPPPAPPAVGSCHQLSHADALAPTASDESTSCRTSTSVTFHVGTLPRTADGAPVAVDSAEAQEKSARVCTRELRAFLGGTREQRRLSVLTTVWFTPTLAQADAGADWFRCDLVAPWGKERLMRVSRGMRDSAGTEKAAKYALCGKGRPSGASFAHTPCAKRHTWRAVATVDLAGDRFPGRAEVARQMEQTCTDAATDAADDKRDVQWSQEGPTRAQWKAGQRHGLCWVPV